jgi:prepilin-type N-terminal cleavage/methylation domain-containing protein/prepilin-type processing-associated H-X9-DG protein
VVQAEKAEVGEKAGMKKRRIVKFSERRFSPQDGFTLVELLVVIAIIAVIAAVLLPVLNKAKQSAQNITCLNNLRQLQLCWHLYIVDNNDYVVPNNSVAFITPGTNTSTSNMKGVSWLPDVNARMETDPSNIISGLLYQYNSQLGIYHCPSDVSTLETPSGLPLNQLRWRSYNLSQSMNGYPNYPSPGYPNGLQSYIPMWDKMSEIRHPSPSDVFVFIDEDSDCVLDAEFGNPPAYENWNVWWDLPSSRHNQGGNLSFADGHVEHWKWAVPKFFYDYVQDVPPPEMPDFKRIQTAMDQVLNPN